MSVLLTILLVWAASAAGFALGYVCCALLRTLNSRASAERKQ